MAICAVFTCDTNNTKNKKNKTNQVNGQVKPIKLFRFPKDPAMAKIWVSKCGRKDKINVQTAYICSKHFTHDQYLRNLQHELLKYSPKNFKKLKNDAIPTENLPFPSSSLKENNDQDKHRADPLNKRHRQCEAATLLANHVLEEEQIDDPLYVEEERLELSMPDENTDNLKETISRLQEKIKTLEEEKASQQEKITTLEEEKTSRQSKILELTRQNYKLLQECNTTNSIFSSAQKTKLGQSDARVRWSIDDISKCIALHASGPKAYRFLLQNSYPFPSVITLKKWASKIDVAPGFLKTVFNLMRNANPSQRDRVCMLMADEMDIRPSYEYDQKADTLLGPAKYAQVIMARGIFSNWKQPLYYNYDKKLTRYIIDAAIANLDLIGYHVVAITMDLRDGNRHLLREYGVDENKPYIQHPIKKNRKVFTFADVPHMVKLLRNHFLDKGIFIDNKHLTLAPLVELLENDNSDLKIAPRFTSEHLAVEHSKRQKVKYATQLFSHTNSRALNRMGMLGILKSPNWQELADLINTVDAWFDIFNSKVQRVDSRPRKAAYGLETDYHEKVLNKMESIVQRMRFGKKSGLLPFQQGILMSIRSLKMLFEYLQESYNAAYILTHRLNKDLLEMFFEVIRAKGGLHDHPSSLKFKYRLRSYLLGRNEGKVYNALNVAAFGEGDIQMDVDMDADVANLNEEGKLLTSELLSSFIDCDAVSPDNDDIWTNEEDISDIEYDSLENLAGYLLKRYKFKIPNLIDTYAEKDDSIGLTWIDEVNKGDVHKPNELFISELKKLDLVFRKYNNNKSALKPSTNYIQNMCSLSIDCSLDAEVMKTFFRCKMYFRIRIQNQNLQDFATNSVK